jgi:hypothetical protein
MRTLFTRLSVSLLTFVIGVCATTVRPTADLATEPAGNAVAAADPLPAVHGPTHCTFFNTEASEETAVRLAEEFVASNGYTDLPAEGNHLSYESIEWASDNDKLLWARHDTLERKAYGMRYSGRTGEAGWTVVFKYRKHPGGNYDKVGRAVTMDRDFGNLRVEHSDFFLAGVEKKL